MNTLELVARFLEEDVAPKLAESDRRMRFHALIAANQLREEARLAVQRPHLEEQEAQGLQKILGAEAHDLEDARRQLAQRLRSGQLDDELPELARHLRAVLDFRLAVQKPGFSRQSDFD